ncbi:MAG TPA: alpha/beta hydrolase [Steroidobacteraceae bacterium]|jgi:pimeloyl-ACP methyl ester carboxylesterase|nr:alpha/beta hydrolase [Steroidobacteraceae bacterium]
MRPTARRIALVVLAALLVAVHYARRLPAHRPLSTPRPAAATAPLDQLRIGTLQLRRCELGRRGAGGVGTADAFCTAFDVPEDWDAPSGRHIQLRVAIVRSAAARAEPDLVAFLDGGPGGAATEDYPQIAPALAELRQRRDILLVDQRGTGGSNALACAGSDEAGRGSLALAKPQDMAAIQRLVQQCLAAVRGHAAPEHYTTTDAIRDLEAIRVALGAPQLDLLGISYGTRVAQQFAARYPRSVRSVVLDSVAPNSLVLGSEHARNLEQVLQSLFARCSADERCKHSFGDSYATLYRVRDRLRAQPQALSLRDPSTFEPLHLNFSAADLATIVRINTYSPVSAALLPLTLHEADQGNYAPLAGQKKWIADDLGSQIDDGMELSVICAEDADLLVARPEDAATLLGNDQIAKIQSACTVWPRGYRPADFHQPFASTLPVLLLAGQRDPVTPAAYAKQMLPTLPNARLLLAPGQGHGVIGAGCMPRLVGEFVQELKPQALDDRCLLQLGDIPAFIDFNGAEP